MEVPKRRRLIMKFKGGPYSLVRSSDGRGDSGQMLKSIDPNTQEQVGENGEIYENCWIRCGSFTARTFEAQDWWMCTPMVKIVYVDEPKNRVAFTTRNSTYILRGTTGMEIVSKEFVELDPDIKKKITLGKRKG
jgi:hypothetical protein